MKKIICLTILIIANYTVNAQLYKKHDWNEKYVFNDLLESEKKLHSVAIKEKYLIQYTLPLIGGSTRLFETKHSIIRVNTDKGLQRHNRVYIPTRDVKEVIDIKARVLKEDGTIKYLDKKNIKELKDVKNYGGFKIFAIEGVTKNSQLEFIYTLEKRPQSLGTIMVQKDYKVREAEVIIRKPFTLKSRIKSYNGFPELLKKRVEGKKDAFTAKIENIDAMTKESLASAEANRMKVVYQVSRFLPENQQMWNNLKYNIQNNYIKIKPNKSKPLIDDYLKYTKNNPRSSGSEVVNNICEYITSNYNIIRTRNDELSELKTIIKKKQATEAGILKVYSCLFNYEDLDFELVLTSNRFRHKFDETFFSNDNLQNVLFYIKNEERYIEPEYVNARLIAAPEETISNRAIFISSKGSRFANIHVPQADYTIIKRDFKIEVDTEELIPTISCEHKVSGYRGSNSRGAYKYLKTKDLNQFKSFTTVSGIEDAEFTDFEVKNEKLSLGTANIPFQFNYEYTSESLIENINNDIILNYGKVIGTQTEFYQEAKRVNSVELRALMKYKYTIKIKIPEGYEAIELDEIKIDKILKINNAIACSFISDYTLNNNIIEINVTETYDKLNLDLRYYEAYKDVVNAAFDFSNKSLLLKKI